MSFTTILKYNFSKIKAPNLIDFYLFRLYNHLKFEHKIRKIKRKLKGNGVSYAKKYLFNDANSKVLFIHIPKAAGMSVVKTLYNSDKSHHASASDYLKEDKSQFESVYSFAITRNPYMRLYSAYYYLKNGGMNKIDRAWWELYLAQYESFEAFVIEGGLKFAIENKAEHFIPQYKFIFDEQNNLQCNYVGKIENINDIELILSKKLQREIIFTHTNVMNKSKLIIRDIYTDEMLKVVNQCYQKDFILLAYNILPVSD